MRLSAIFFAALLATFPATAGEVRLMTLDNETSTSDCIGDPKTPLCAVETRDACTLRNIKHLCDMIETKLPTLGKLTPTEKESYVGISAFSYEIISQRKLSNSEIAQLTAKYGDGPWRVGDVAVTQLWTVCRPEDQCITDSRNDPARAFGEGCPARICRRGPAPETTIVRRKGDRWVIVRDYLEFID